MTARSRAASPASSAAPTSSTPRGGDFAAGADAPAGGVAPAASSAGTSAGTAIVARPLPFVRRPGTCSSSTAWKFVPPKPNALTPATRLPPFDSSQSRSSVLTANGVADQSTFGFGRAKPRLGGSSLWWIASAALSIPAAPAAAFRWPMFDFTEPSAIEPGARPAPANASPRLFNSTWSPTAVEVPWPSISEHSAGDTPALLHARSIASFWPIGFGAVMPLPLPSLDPAMPRTTA